MGLMTKVKLDEIGALAAYGEDQRYLLADGVQVYLYAGSAYVPANLAVLAAMENHTIYGYYDESIADEGAIRVITAVKESD